MNRFWWFPILFAGLSVFVVIFNFTSQSETLNLDAFPNPPQVMYGKVFLQNGSLLGPGYLIEARVNSIHYAQKVGSSGTFTMETRTHSTSNGYNYGVADNFQICADNTSTLSAIEGVQQGDEIEFYIEGTKGTVLRPGVDQVSRPTLPFKSGTVVNANILLPTNTLSAGSKSTNNLQKANVCKDIWGTPTATPIGTATPTATKTPRTAATRVPTATPQGGTGTSNENSGSSGNGTSSSSSGGGGGGGSFFVPPTATPIQLVAVAAPVFQIPKSALLPPTPTPTSIPTVTPVVLPTSTPILPQIVKGKSVPIKVSVLTSLSKTEESTATPSPLPTPTPTPTPTPQIIETAQKLIREVSEASTEEAVNALESETVADAAVVMEKVEALQAAEIVQEIETNKAAEIVEKIESGKAAEIVEKVGAQKAAEIVEKVISEKAAEIIQEIETNKAAEIVSKIETKKAAEIVNSVESSKAAEIIQQVDDEKAADIVEKVEIATAAAIVEKVNTVKAAEIVKKVETVKAAKIVENVESNKAAKIVERVESAKAAEIVEKVESAKAAEIVGKIESTKAAEIVGKVESTKAAEIVGKVESTKAAEIVGKVESEKAAEIVEKIESVKAAEIVQNVGTQKAADIVKSVNTAKAADIVKSVESGKAASILGKVESTKAAEIVGKVESTKAAEIVGKFESTKAAEIVEKVESTKAAEIVEKVESTKAAEIVEKVESTKAAEIVEKVTTEKSVQILSEVQSSKVGEILDEVTSKKVSDVVIRMDEKTLVDKLPEMTASKMFNVPAFVLLKAMPNVPSEQLIAEVSPQKDPRLPDPVSVVLTENSVSYKVPVTVMKSWTKLVGSPKPIDEILVRFNQELPDVNILIETLETPSYELNSSCAGFEIYSSFRATLGNAIEGSINTAHMRIYVDKIWMETHDIHKWSISGHVRDETAGTWTKFPSKRVSEDSENIYYTFSFPEFSEIAISGCSSIPTNHFLTSDLGFTLLNVDNKQNLRVSATVENTDLVDRNYMAILWINNSSEISRRLFVPAHSAVDINFELPILPGLQSIRVDRLQGELEIKPSVQVQPSSKSLLFSILVYASVAFVSLGLGLSGVWALLIRKSKNTNK